MLYETQPYIAIPAFLLSIAKADTSISTGQSMAECLKKEISSC
jgi:hypothetical protein